MALLLTITVTNTYAAIIDDKRPKKEKVADMTEEQKRARLEEIKNRVNEIKPIDRSTLTKTDRKALKKELREMNKEARVMKGGIYLSVGAIIIIILVLILIL
jgi:DNA-binding protein H-NS